MVRDRSGQLGQDWVVDVAPRAWWSAITPGLLLLLADLAATLLFAIEGAAASVPAGLDVFGLLVVGFTSALVGGIVRDVLLGDGPPQALRSVLYPTVGFVGGALVFVLYQLINNISSSVLNPLDAAGLGLFAVAGTTKALDYKLNGVSAVLLGTITAVGGGVTRDVLLRQVPVVLRAHIYAVAALAGATVVVIATKRGLPRGPAMAIGAATCFFLRMVSIWEHWNLPRVHG
jgi:uncharacterized membrane protein YeiH